MSKRITLYASIVLSLLAATALAPSASAADPRAFELRTYTAADGKLDALNTRFREHTIALFEKHGMQVVGFWTPTGDGAENTLVYLLAYTSANGTGLWRREPFGAGSSKRGSLDLPLKIPALTGTQKIGRGMSGLPCRWRGRRFRRRR